MSPAVPAGPPDEQSVAARIDRLIRDVPDYPSPGILFKDIGPLLADGPALADVADALLGHPDTPAPDLIAAVEARGFLFGAAAAARSRLGVVPIRKAGKLPGDLVGRDYALEYGSARLEVQADALKPGQRVLLVDDVLATGGTLAAAAELIAECGAVVVGIAVVLEIAALGGRSALPEHAVRALRTC